MTDSAPKNGIVDDAPQSRAGVSRARCRASVSPGSAPSTKNGPVCGLTSVMSSTSLARCVVLVSRPENASSVHSFRHVPGAIRCVGATPPNVHAYSWRSGRYSTTCIRRSWRVRVRAATVRGSSLEPAWSVIVHGDTVSVALIREMFAEMVVRKDPDLIARYDHPDFLLTTNGSTQDWSQLGEFAQYPR